MWGLNSSTAVRIGPRSLPTPEGQHLVAQLAQGAHHVVLGLPVGGLELVPLARRSGGTRSS